MKFLRQERWGAELASSFVASSCQLEQFRISLCFIFQKYVPHSLLLTGYVRRKNKIKICC